MSFSLSLKQEILLNRPMRVRQKRAQAYGLFLFGKAFSAEEMSLHTENEETVKLYQWFVRDILGKTAVFHLEELRRSTRTVYTVELPLEADRLRVLKYFGQGTGINRENLATLEGIYAFISGAYLACGNITDPEKSYHMEFVVREEPVCRDFTALLQGNIPGARISRRRQNYVVYYKECGPIEDLMTIMGASKSCLAVIDIEMYKSVRNQANRAVNCETANIDKQVDAAAAQVEDIELVLAKQGEDSLPEELRQVARLRLDNPEGSLRELAQLSPQPLSRSAVHRRLDKLSKIAAHIRTQSTGGDRHV